METEAPWTTSAHPKLGFSIQHPESWEVYPDAMGCALVLLEPVPAPVPFRPNVNVTIHPAASLEQFVAEEEARAKTVLNDFTTADLTELEIGGRRALRTSASFQQGAFLVATSQWHLDAPGLIVTVSSAAVEDDYERLEEVLERIATSLRGSWEAGADG